MERSDRRGEIERRWERREGERKREERGEEKETGRM